MSTVKSQLDIYNPAEFYAVLGLLTVFSLQHPGTDIVSHFQVAGHLGNDNATFIASCDEELSVEQVSADLAHPEVRVDKTANVWRNPKENPNLVAPVILAASGWHIVLDWWLDDLRYNTNGLKLWSGNSNPAEMLRSFIRLGTDFVNAGGTVFGFDTRSSRDALEVGYSKKDTREKAGLYPRTELLCGIGLQRYRPHNQTYYAWHKPVLLSISYAAAIQEISGLPQSCYEFEVRKVGQGAKEVIPAKNKFLAASTSR